jgi:hypothetical protein
LLVSRLHRKLAHGVVFQTVLHPSWPLNLSWQLKP